MNPLGLDCDINRLACWLLITHRQSIIIIIIIIITGSSAGIVFTHGPIWGFFAPQGRHVAPIKVISPFMIFAVFDVLLAVNMCINYSFFTFIVIIMVQR